MEMKLWAPWAIGCKKGQAILELALFGSILIILLGVLINYGMRYNFQQQVMQQAFRKALGLAAARRSATYVLIKDRHIPDPSNPFGVGSLTPVSSTASVTRNYRLNETADNQDELPAVHFDINGDVRRYIAAGEDGAPGEIMDYASCKADCAKSGGAEWYCDKLDQLFPEERPMGLQQDYTQDFKMDSKLNKQAGGSGITTSDTVDWQYETKRTIVYRPFGDKSGNTVEEEIVSSVSQERTDEWETSF